MVHQAQEKNLIAVLVQDHDEIRRCCAALEAAQDPLRRREAAHELTTAVARHFSAEEMHLYPEARDSLPDGMAIAAAGLSAHTEMARRLKRGSHLSPDDATFAEFSAQLRAHVLEHMAEEERDLFPALEQVLPPERLHELGIRVEQTERIGPTRPHTGGPHRPPVNKLIGPGIGIIDHLLDRLASRH